MKLKTKFTWLAVWLVIQMLVLSAGLVLVSLNLFSLKNYQYVLTRAQYHVADISDYINRIMYQGADVDKLYEEWQEKLSETTDTFEQFANDNVRTSLPEEDELMLDQLSAFWLILKARFSTFETHLKNISTMKTAKDLKFPIMSQGLMNVWEKMKDDEQMKGLSFEIVVIDSEMNTLHSAKDSLAQVVTKLSSSIKDHVDMRARVIFMSAIIFSVVSSFLMLIIIVVITSRITRRVGKVNDLSTTLAGKDLTRRTEVSGHDEIAAMMRNMNNTVSELNHFILIVQQTASRALSAGFEINDSTSDAAAAVGQINKSIEEMNQEFDSLSLSVKNTVDSINQIEHVINTLVQHNSEQTSAISNTDEAVHQVAKTLEEISRNARERTKSAEEMQVLVADGDSKIASTNEILTRITSQLDEVSEIVTIINSIAQQTNMLSMNAAIESAHAGEAGKGFSVVADEIRKLAESTSDNAKQISTSISGIVDKVREANESSNTAALAFEKVDVSARTMLESFKTISAGIDSIDERTRQITAHTTSIADTANQINGYCDNLTEQQRNISQNVSRMQSVFDQSMHGINEIRLGTQDIVNRMQNVTDQSTVSYQKMTELREILGEFQTDEEADAADMAAAAEKQAAAEAAADTESADAADAAAEPETVEAEEPLVTVDSVSAERQR